MITDPATDFASTWASVAGIDGWLTEGQARMLFKAAENVRVGESIVEIGSHHGRSTIILGRAKDPLVRLVAVDPFGDPRWGGGEDALATFHSNLARHGLDKDIRHVRSLGAELGRSWDGGPVGLLFVDGAHDFPTVAADLKAWLPHLSPDATVLMHDVYSSPGVTRAAFGQFFPARDFEFIGSSRSLIAFRRCALSPAAVRRSRGRMLVKLPWLARNLAVKLAMRRGWQRLPALLGHRETTAPY